MSRTLRRLTYAAIASTALAGATLLPAAGYAASDSTDQVVEASKSGVAHPSLQLSQDGFNVMRDIRAARVAIFNGDTDGAKKFVDQAAADLDKTRKDDTVVHGKGGKEADGNLIPIDGQLVIADNFVSTPEKAGHVEKGNQKIQEGKTDEAIQELKLAEVDVGFTRLLMPLDKTATHVDAAADLIGNQKYYEANMALKAAEDGLNIETVMLVEDPAKDQTMIDQTAAKAADQEAAQPASN